MNGKKEYQGPEEGEAPYVGYFVEIQCLVAVDGERPVERWEAGNNIIDGHGGDSNSFGKSTSEVSLNGCNLKGLRTS